MLTLHTVKLRAVSVPLKRPVVSKVGHFDSWPIILCDLQTQEGPVGRSYLEPYLAHAIPSIIPAAAGIVERFKGQPLGPIDLFDQARRSLSLVGLEGISLAAVSLIDMAFWDAHAQAAGQPLCVFLGGSPAPVPAYNSNGLWLSDPAGLDEEASALVAEGGFTGLKLRLGRDALDDDLNAIQNVRAACGNAVKLMVDFNQGLTLDAALQRCRDLDAEGLYWLEEPIAYDNTSGYRALRERLRTPLQIGENFWGPRDAAKALEARACDFIMPDLMRIGGVTGWLRTAAIAAAGGTPFSSHLYPEFSAHLLRVTETAHWLEWQDWADPILAEPFRVADGHLHIPDRPGAGIAWDEDAVARYALEV
ncbi:MAG: enolase C-terminal domain-like protein [Pseudomonadota bacterium]